MADIKQKGECNDVFGEEVRHLVTQAYPGSDLEMPDQAFVRGYCNSRIAYYAFNRAPRTLNDALELVTSQEHNYKATLGRDYDQQKRYMLLLDRMTTSETSRVEPQKRLRTRKGKT